MNEPGDQGYTDNFVNNVDAIAEKYNNIITEITFGLTTSNCLSLIANLVSSGFELIFCQSDFEPCMIAAANTYPNISFVMETNGTTFGLSNLATMSEYVGVLYGTIAAGVLAQKQPGVNNFCFMTAIGSSAIRWSNTFKQGITNRNHIDPVLKVGLTNGFNNHTSEDIIFDRLMSSSGGCDVLFMHLNTDYVLTRMQSLNKYGVGFALDMGDIVGDEVLVSVLLYWFDSFDHYVSKFLSGNYIRWEESFLNYATPDTIISDYSPLASRKAKKEADKILKKLYNGSVHPYCGKAVRNTYGTKCVSEAVYFANYLSNINVIMDV